MLYEPFADANRGITATNELDPQSIQEICEICG
jgi:hypothetical protein